MKIFAIVFKYTDYNLTKNQLGTAFIEAETEEEAKINYGYGGIVAVKEVTLDELIKTGYHC